MHTTARASPARGRATTLAPLRTIACNKPQRLAPRLSLENTFTSAWARQHRYLVSSSSSMAEDAGERLAAPAPSCTLPPGKVGGRTTFGLHENVVRMEVLDQVSCWAASITIFLQVPHPPALASSVQTHARTLACHAHAKHTVLCAGRAFRPCRTGQAGAQGSGGLRGRRSQRGGEARGAASPGLPPPPCAQLLPAAAAQR